MPMEDNSTQSILSNRSIPDSMTCDPAGAVERCAEAPRQSTLEFLRRFARCYVTIGSLPAELSGMAIN